MKANKARVKYNSAMVMFAEVSQLISTNIPMKLIFHLANRYNTDIYVYVNVCVFSVGMCECAYISCVYVYVLSMGVCVCAYV